MPHPLSRLLVLLSLLIAAWLAASGTAAQTRILPPSGSAITAAPSTVAAAPAAISHVVTTEQVRAELVAHAPEGVEPGKPVWLGLLLTHKPEWHTYWKNPGDSGLPTQLEWTLPAGVRAGEIQWPLPRKIPIGTLANYGYEGKLLLPVPVQVSPAFSASRLDVRLKAAWLVCRKECIPEEGEFSLSVPVKGSTGLNGADFAAAAQATPRMLPDGLEPSAVHIDGQSLKFSIQNLPVALRGKKLEFFPETPEVIETAAPITQGWSGAVWKATVPLSAQRSNSPTVIPVVVAADGQGWRTEVKVAGSWPAVAQAAGVSPALEAALKENAQGARRASQMPANDIGLWAALLGAFIGGLILNLMPCVFPVLAIKLMAFARHADDQRQHRASGIAYTVGVVLSFLALGALMIGLRAAGDSIGWGFQLQNPWVVAGLAALFTLIGLNLAGLFEFGQVLPASLAGLQLRNPTLDALLSGVLAVAIASPCTAPFMGASLGFAVGLPAAQALLVFTAIGIGMALPYLAASLVPGVARSLPQPGAWMQTLRQFMAFPMFATVVWLVWVLGQQSGIDGAGALLALLVALTALIWALTLSGRSRRILATLTAAAALWGAWALGPSIARELPPVASVADGRWQAWAPGKVDQLLASGQPVFVDFTAAWCVTCQYNKKTTLAHADVMGEFYAKQVALLRADWTRRDPAITQALADLGRNGVPVYVLYKKGAAPVVLSEVLSVEEVLSQLAKL